MENKLDSIYNEGYNGYLLVCELKGNDSKVVSICKPSLKEVNIGTERDTKDNTMTLRTFCELLVCGNVDVTKIVFSDMTDIIFVDDEFADYQSLFQSMVSYTTLFNVRNKIMELTKRLAHEWVYCNGADSIDVDSHLVTETIEMVYLLYSLMNKTYLTDHTYVKESTRLWATLYEGAVYMNDVIDFAFKAKNEFDNMVNEFRHSPEINELNSILERFYLNFIKEEMDYPCQRQKWTFIKMPSSHQLD